jgi:hypothetical protein
MPLTVTTPYKTNTVSSVSGTTFVSNGTPFVVGDIGRVLRFTSGNAAGQTRKITAYTNSTTVTVEFAWNTSPISGITESLPTAGDTWQMSHFLSDLADGTNLIARNTHSYEFVGTGHSLSNCTIYDTLKSILWDSNGISLAATAGMRFGDIRSDGIVLNGCNILNNASGLNGFSTGGVAGDVVVYGGSIFGLNSNSYWRLYRGSAQVARLVSVSIYGPFGGRWQGTKSCLVDVTSRGNSPAFNFTSASPIGLIQGLRIYVGNYAYFWNPLVSANTTVTGLDFSNLTAGVVQLSGTGTSYTLTLLGINLNTVAAQPTYLVSSSITVNQYVDTKNSLGYSVQTVAGAAIPSPRIEVRDVSNAVVLDQTPAGGVLSPTYLRCVYHTITAAGSSSLTQNSVDSRPFSTKIRHYNYLESASGWDGNTSIAPIMALLGDTSIVQATAATVAAYTTLGTLDKLRDYIKYQTTQDMTFADAGVGAGRIDMGSRNLTVDATAGSVWAYASSTATIKASAMVAGSTYLTAKTVNLTLANGATWAVPVEVTGVASVGPLGNLTGNLSLTGTGRLDFIGGSGAVASVGSAASGTTVRVTSATSGAVLDFRAFTFDAATTFENTSGVPVTLKLNPTQTAPILLPTSGSITLDNAASATLTVSGFASGSDVVIYNADLPSTGDGSNVIATFDAVVGTSVGYSYTYAPNTHVNVGVFLNGKVPLLVGPVTLSVNDAALPVAQKPDPNYVP